MTDNMELWKSWCDTAALGVKTKEVNVGNFSFTAIDAQSQIKIATEKWGPYGIRWGVKNIEWGTVGKLKTTKGKLNPVPVVGPAEITLSAIFFYPDGEFWIGGDCYWRPDGDSRKKLLTDVTTKALSKLGMCSDIFEGKFDGNKYNEPQAQPTQQYQQPPQTSSQPVQQQSTPQPVQTPSGTPNVPQSDEMHPLFIENAEAAFSKVKADGTGGNAMIKIRALVTEGPYNGKKVYEYLLFGEGFMFNKANRFVQCATGTGIVNAADTAGIAQTVISKSILAKLKTESYQGKDSLKIDGMEMAPITTVPPAATHAPAQQEFNPATTEPPDDLEVDEDIMMEDDEFL